MFFTGCIRRKWKTEADTRLVSILLLRGAAAVMVHENLCIFSANHVKLVIDNSASQRYNKDKYCTKR